MPIVVAVDAMGGDFAPAAVVEGAVSAAARGGVSVALAGPRQVIEHELARRGAHPSASLSILDAPDVIGMHESALAGFRRKRRSSVRVATEAVAAGSAAAVFSAGHSGATVLSAQAAFGLIDGIDRPALAVTVPTLAGAAVLLDAGATLECRPEYLLQFALMGSTYARLALSMPRPRVGLLSIGEEAGKGNDLTREAHRLFAAANINFIGNLEARELFTGRAEVIVCDGFTGNIALKVGEGLVEATIRMLRDELGGAWVSQIGALLTRHAFERFRQRVDYAEYGAGLLLGVRGLTFVGHGRSSARAVESGIAMAARLAHGEVLTALAGSLSGTRLAEG
jgi:glycerol-3-phosphate acyltransferase PlsX